MHLPWAFHGEVSGTKEVYGPGLGIESLISIRVALHRHDKEDHRQCADAAVAGPGMQVGFVPGPFLSTLEWDKRDNLSYCESALAPTSSI
jgi:hypothetical protein